MIVLDVYPKHRSHPTRLFLNFKKDSSFPYSTINIKKTKGIISSQIQIQIEFDYPNYNDPFLLNHRQHRLVLKLQFL